MAMTISGTSGLTFPDTTTQAAAAVSPIGVSQTWQNVTGSRAASTTYTNSTGKAIAVSVEAYPRDVSCSLTVGGVVASVGNAGAGSYARQPLFAIVPNGVTYSYAGNGFEYWAELR